MEAKLGEITVTRTVQSVDVEDNDRLIDKATIVLEDPWRFLSDLPEEGQIVKIDMGWENDHAILFEGDVIRCEVQSRGCRSQRVTITAFDPSYRLMNSPEASGGHVGKLSEILETIVQESNSGIQIGQIAPNPDPEFTEDEPLRQTNMSPWQFIQELAERYNARAFVEYNEGASKFYFIPESQLLQTKLITLQYYHGLGQVIDFTYQRVASGASPQRTAVASDPATGEPRVSTSPPVEPEPPLRGQAATRARLRRESDNAADAYDVGLEAAASAPARRDTQLARSTLVGLASDPQLAARQAEPDRTRLLGYYGRGTALGTTRLRAKGVVTIEGVAEWAEGDWYVRKVNHVFTRSQLGEQQRSTYRTRFAVTK